MIALALFAAPALAKPQRIVSLNLCADELTLRLADPDAVASVSFLSQDPRYANLASLAAAAPANHGHAEEALAFRPDLVLAGPFADPSTVALLRRLGVEILQVGAIDTLDAAHAQIRTVAAALEEERRGEALIAEIDRRLEEAAVDRRLPRLRAVVLGPNGLTIRPGSLIDEVLASAGLINVGADFAIGAERQLPLEALVQLDPDVLILDRDDAGGPSLAAAILDHPVVRALARRMTVVSVPSRLWTCAGPGIAEAAQRLADATASARAVVR